MKCVKSYLKIFTLEENACNFPDVSIAYSRDAERKRKVKELLGSLSAQEGEWKALKKMKKK